MLPEAARLTQARVLARFVDSKSERFCKSSVLLPEHVWNGPRNSQTHSSKGFGKIWNPSLKDFAGGPLCCQNLSGMTQEAAGLTLARVLARFGIQV